MHRTHRLAAALIGGFALLPPPGRKTTPLDYESPTHFGQAWARRLGILEGA